MHANLIPVDIAFAVTLILAFEGYSIFTAPRHAVELAVRKALEHRPSGS
ncbi:MAG: hypothetical protein HY055_11095 [Magnetospirillum sp.]|nr:hypothetical protein [Magnetospirillum sp.]